MGILKAIGDLLQGGDWITPLEDEIQDIARGGADLICIADTADVRRAKRHLERNHIEAWGETWDRRGRQWIISVPRGCGDWARDVLSQGRYRLK